MSILSWQTMRWSFAISSVLLILTIALLSPTVSGDGINVLEVQEGYEKIDEATESITFTWVAYNNDTSPYLLEVVGTLGPNDEGRLPSNVDLGIGQDYSTFEPGTSREIVIVLSSTQAVESMDFPIHVNMTFTKMSDPDQVYLVTKSAMVHVEALFESTGNKIFGIWDNNFPSPFNTLIWSFIFTVIFWLAIAAFIYFIVDPFIHMLTRKTKTDLDDRILEVTRVPIFLLIVIFGLVDSLSIIDIPQEWHVNIILLYQILLILVLAYVAYLIFDRVIIHYAQKWSKVTDTEVDDVLVPLFHKAGLILIPTFALGAVLSLFGIDLTLLVAGFGVIGIVIAFAVQETLSNVFAGMQLLLDRPFNVGDLVEIDTGEICEVKKIGLRSTTMYNTADHEIIVVPNNDVVNKKVINYSRPDMHRSMSAEVGVAYGTDLNKVKEVLLKIASDHPDIIRQDGQMPYVRLAKFGDSSVDFKLWYWVEIKKMWRVASEVRQAIYDRFMAEGIEIPFPQNVVTLKSDRKGP